METVSKPSHVGSMSVLLVAAMLLSFLPFIIVRIFGIWPPVAMVHEMFAVNYFNYPLLQIAYSEPISRTGHLFLLLFTYGPGFIVDTVFSGFSNFEKFEIYSVLFYLEHGVVLMAVYAVAFRSGLRTIDKALLLFVPFAPMFLERVTNFDLMINYHKGEEVLYLILTFLLMRWLDGEPPPETRRTLFLGALAGIAVGVKATLLSIIAPPLFFLSVPLNRGIRAGLRHALIFVLSAGFIFSLLLFAYLFFDVGYLKRFFGDRLAYATFALDQRAPFLHSEIKRFLDPGSYYFGLHIVFILYIFLALTVVILCFRERDRRLILFMATQAVALMTLSYMFKRRATQGTMIDIILFFVFGLVMMIFLLMRHMNLRRFVIPALFLLIFAYGGSLSLTNPASTLRRLQTNSELAREFETFLAENSHLPVVYYKRGLPQPLLFPSTDLIAAIAAAGFPRQDVFWKRHSPRTRWAYPRNGALRTPHIAVIPEYVNVILQSPETKREWPDMWKKIDVLETFPAFARALGARSGRCRVFQFVETQPREVLLHFYFHPTRVTVCIVE